RPTAAEADLVDHAVAVEGVVETDGLVHRVLGVAQVDTLEIVGQLTLDLEVLGVPLAVGRRPGTRPVRMAVVLGDGRVDGVDHSCVHGAPQGAVVTTNV